MDADKKFGESVFCVVHIRMWLSMFKSLCSDLGRISISISRPLKLHFSEWNSVLCESRSQHCVGRSLFFCSWKGAFFVLLSRDIFWWCRHTVLKWSLLDQGFSDLRMIFLIFLRFPRQELFRQVLNIFYCRQTGFFSLLVVSDLSLKSRVCKFETIPWF